MSVKLHHGDMLDVIPRLVAEGVAVDAVVTDAPYHLLSVSRNGSARQNDPATPFGRTDRGGFMNMTWDGGDIAFRPKTWAAVATIMRPGAFLLAFGGTRTFHRIWCAIEDAGFIMQDTICWMYGSGFPKRRDALKPAWEPICVAYKLGGARTLHVDECRIPTNGEAVSAGGFAMAQEHPGWDRPGHTKEHTLARQKASVERANNLGRWPANIVLSEDPEVMEAFAAFGERPTGNLDRSRITAQNQIFGQRPKDLHGTYIGDSGTAARFFYCAKADKQDRWGSKHPTVKPVELIRHLVKLVCPPGGTFLDPFAGSGTAAVAALAEGRNAILIEREESYVADIRERIAYYEGGGRHSLASKNRNRSEATGTLL